MKNIRKILILLLSLGLLYALHGKIVFFDGTYVVGKVTKIDESTVYIVPIGLDTPEGVLVNNIDSLKLENGMVPVINSAVKYFLNNGEFLTNDSDWMDEYDDFQYDDYATLQEEPQYAKINKTHQEYYSVGTLSGFPFPLASLADSLKETTLSFNLGAEFQAPYYPIGAVDISPGMKFMTFGFNSPEMGMVKAFQIIANTSIDFKPVLYFLPKNLHLATDIGLIYNIGIDFQPGPETVEKGATYGGIGYFMGSSIDYWFNELPLGFKFWSRLNVIPQAPPFEDESTMYANLGISLIIVLKRNN